MATGNVAGRCVISKSAPKPPDPFKTAQAQTESNRETAITQQQLNMVNQSNPFGSVGYQQVGTWPDGTPRYEQTGSFSPEMQANFDAYLGAMTSLSQQAQQQADRYSQTWGGGIDMSGAPDLLSGYAGADDFSADRQRVEDALWQRGAGERAQQEQQLRAILANKGIREGSAAWNAEMERMARQNADAQLATILAGGQEQSRLVDMAQSAAGFQNTARAQALQEQLARQGMDLQAMGGLMGLGSGGIMTPGGFAGAAPQTGVAGTDIAGLVQKNYEAQLDNYQNQMGGLFGLGGSLLNAAGAAGGFGALFSDEALKTDVHRIGTADNGLPIYRYRYVWGGPMHIGVMAQDVEEQTPEAVSMHPSGYRQVDYGRVAW